MKIWPVKPLKTSWVIMYALEYVILYIFILYRFTLYVYDIAYNLNVKVISIGILYSILMCIHNK
jgi:hypothetical protein